LEVNKILLLATYGMEIVECGGALAEPYRKADRFELEYLF